MSSILAFDASGDNCSVTLSLSSGIVNTLRSAEPRAHAEKLLPFAQDLLNQVNIRLSDVDAIACAAGPGSFTGLRIALSIAQGLAYSNNKPMILVNSLAAMVKSIEPLARFATYLPLIDARMDEVYWGKYTSDAVALDASNVAAIGQKNTFKSTIELISQQHSSIIALGSGWQSVPFASEALLSLGLECNPQAHPDSLAVAQLAHQLFNDGAIVDPQSADLFYCRDSVAWNKRKRIRTQ